MSTSTLATPATGAAVAPRPAATAPAGLTPPATLLSSTIGRKSVMAVTGIVLYGFVIGHLVGNLQVFLGEEAFDAYAVFLRAFLHGAGIRIARSGLLVALLLHLWAAASLTLANRRARPKGYQSYAAQRSTYASRTMVWTGPILLLFVFYHLAHLTFGGAHPDFVHGRVYHNFVTGFMDPLVCGIYAVAQIALGLHLYHGGWSMLQTLGLSHPRYDRLRNRAAGALALLITLGNLSMPFAVLTGLLR